MVPLLSAILRAGLGKVEFEGEVVFEGDVVFEEEEEEEGTSDGEVSFVVLEGRDWAVVEGRRDVMVKRRDRTARRVCGICRAIVRVPGVDGGVRLS